MSIFKNAPLDKDGNTQKSWKDWFQAKCVVLGTTQQQLDNADWLFETSLPCPGQMPCAYALDRHGPGIIHKGLLLNSQIDEKIIVTEKIRLSELLIQVGFIFSKNEFRRKCEQKGLLYNSQPLAADFELNVLEPSISHEVRLGKRFLEIVVPLVEIEDEHI